MEKNLRSKRSQKVCHSLFKTSMIPNGIQSGHRKVTRHNIPPAPPPSRRWATHGHLIVVRAWGGGEFEHCLNGSGEFELEVSSLSSGIQVFYLLIWRCLNS